MRPALHSSRAMVQMENLPSIVLAGGGGSLLQVPMPGHLRAEQAAADVAADGCPRIRRAGRLPRGRASGAISLDYRAEKGALFLKAGTAAARDAAQQITPRDSVRAARAAERLRLEALYLNRVHPGHPATAEATERAYPTMPAILRQASAAQAGPHAGAVAATATQELSKAGALQGVPALPPLGPAQQPEAHREPATEEARGLHAVQQYARTLHSTIAEMDVDMPSAFDRQRLRRCAFPLSSKVDLLSACQGWRPTPPWRPELTCDMMVRVLVLACIIARHRAAPTTQVSFLLGWCTALSQAFWAR